jgi:hypothetical protein
MAFVLIIAGVVLLVAAVRNTQQNLYYLVQGDFSGPNNFIYWVVSILIVGAVGYIPKAKPASDGFLILILLVLFLKKDSGFFDAFQRQLATSQSGQTGKSAAQIEAERSAAELKRVVDLGIRLNDSLAPIPNPVGMPGGRPR